MVRGTHTTHLNGLLIGRHIHVGKEIQSCDRVEQSAMALRIYTILDGLWNKWRIEWYSELRGDGRRGMGRRMVVEGSDGDLAWTYNPIFALQEEMDLQVE